MKQKPTQHKLGDFMEGKGFYIVLFLCIAAIGISGYYLFSGLFAEPEGFGSEPSSVVSGQAELEGDQNPGQQTEETTPPAQDGAAASATEEEKSAESKQDTAGQEKTTPDEEAAASSAYVWPIEGNVDRDFSLEVFAYDATMGDWRTHDGLDIAAELGTPVAACAKGTVTDVSTDDMMGVTVTVDHGKGMESVFSNLAESVNVQPGTEVEAGTVIGTVGTTAVSESADASHLHFSMREYGVAIDPLNYLH